MVQLVQKFMPWSRIRIFRNERTRSTPLDPKLMFRCISFRLGAFGTVSLPHETRCKWAKLLQLMQKFVQQSRVIFFRNERSRSTLLDPKLLFRCVSFILGAFGTVSLLQEARCISLCHKVASEIYAMNGPDPPHWTLNLCFGAFLSIWVRLGPFCYYTKLSAKLVKLLQ